MLTKFIKTHPVHKKIVPYLDNFMLFRPTLFFSVWVMICIGMYISSKLNNMSKMNITEINYTTTLLFLGISLVCGATIILNQISDIESDKINKKNFLFDGIIKVNRALFISRVVSILGLIIVLTVSWEVVVPLLMLYLIWGILYNDERYNWKTNPLLGVFANLACGYLLILCGMVYNRYDMSIQFILFNSFIYIIPFIFAYASIVLLVNIPDKNGDTVTNKNTLTVVLGDRMTILFATILCISSFLIALFIKEPLCSTASLTSIPFFLFAVFRGEDKDVMRAIRYPILLLNFYVLTIYPLLFFPIMSFYYISKYYYWHRFSIHYPTLLVDND